LSKDHGNTYIETTKTMTEGNVNGESSLRHTATRWMISFN